ncbi:MAG: hypothetical protein NTZ68_01890 [Candidatus Dependentiae bacterium]|nr:hypothetical protein [Candidatus Dependentiae bacterium]
MKKIIFLSSLLLMPLSSDLKGSNFSQRFTTRIIPQSVKASMAAASRRVKQAAQTSWSKINKIHVAIVSAVSLSFQKLMEAAECQSQSENHKQNTIERDGLITCTDLKLLKLFNTIKQDMGITEDIPLFIITKKDPLGAFHKIINPSPYEDKYITMGISVNLTAIGNDHTFLINTLAHELGHYLQHNGDQRSYQSKAKFYNFVNTASTEEKKENAIKMETGADAHAAGYQDCKYCLKQVQASLLHNLPKDPKGYFSYNDYAPYCDRAVEHDWTCSAHEHLRKQLFLRQAGHATGLAPIPLQTKDFLPVRDRSNYPDSCVKTPPTF